MKIIYRKRALFFPPVAFGYDVINIVGLWLFADIRSKPLSDIKINHEKIHSPQWLEMGIVPFMLWYFIERLIKFVYYLCTIKAKDTLAIRQRLKMSYLKYIAHLSYRNLSFEREAYENQRNMNYLQTRKWYSWMKYIIKKKAQ